MARNFRVLAALKMDGALPENDVLNTWHFQHDNYPPLTTAEDSANDMVDQLEVFYQLIDTTLFATTVGTEMICRVYDLADPEPRVPIITRTVAITPSPTAALPHEDAAVLSMRAAPISGVPAARLRGRVYLGPLATSMASQQTGGVRITSSALTLVADSAVTAFHTGKTIGDPYLSVFSPTRLAGGVSLNDALAHVNYFKIDNGVDTVRSRGMAADSRQERSLPGR